jgi:lipopolysaccharide transport system ATP-binding protein
MNNLAIRAENISKQYRLGKIGTGTLSHDLNRWWHAVRGKEDPFLKIGDTNDRTVKGESDYVWSLKDINFEINAGDAVGIIGRNGAGKSTLLKLLSKVTKPTTGNFKINGRIASLLEVGTGFHPEMTGRENVYLNGAILGMTKKEISRKFDEIVAFSGVDRYIDTPVKRYSSGMYVRLAFAVAAHLESEILIIDEVLAVGDADFQKKCLGKMGDISKGEGRTVLFVSHNMLAVKSLCNTGIFMENGLIAKTGNIDSVIDTYLYKSNELITSFVALNASFEGITLESIEISNNGINGHFNIEDDLIFNIKLSSCQIFEGINVNIFLNTADGVNIFATCSPTEKQEIGTYVFQCIIPKYTLNDIMYNIELMVVRDGPKVLINLKDLMTIEGIEKKRSGGWLGGFPGLIRPQYFKWNKIKYNE